MSSDEEEEEEKSVIIVVDLCSPSPPIPCAKIMADVKRLEESEDCFVLDFDPSEPVVICDGQADGDDDVSIVAEKGKIASRDYPHARYLCPRHPFGTTPHVRHCKMCYCYVCDTAAPCEKWNDHCNATNDCGLNWRSLRNLTISRREEDGN